MGQIIEIAPPGNVPDGQHAPLKPGVQIVYGAGRADVAEGVRADAPSGNTGNRGVVPNDYGVDDVPPLETAHKVVLAFVAVLVVVGIGLLVWYWI